MEKKTLQYKLSHRKYKKPNKFIWHALNNLVIKPFLAPKFHVHTKVIDDINKCDGPAFLIYNHQSRMDYIYICKTTYPRPLNYMVGYNEFFRSHLSFISKLMHFIPKKNFTFDMESMRALNKIIKQNGVVCFSPEGMSSIAGHNQPVVAGTGRFFKHYKIPVYMVKLNGAYLTNNKICLDERYGEVYATESLLLSKEDLEKLSPEEIQNKVDEALWTDEYLWNKEKHIEYKSNNRICTHLHDLMYRCPKCGEEFHMHGENNEIKCLKCGNGATQDDYYDFHPFEGSVFPNTITEWVDKERQFVYREIKDNPKYEFVEKVKIGCLPKYKELKNKKTSELCGEGTIRINHDGFFFDGVKDGEPFSFKLDYKDFPTLGMVTDVSFFATYVNGEYYDFFPERPCVYKILLLVEEMHRLHVNAWKNFPWMNWIYE